MKKSALVTGAAGQDGTYLTDLLLSYGYTIHAQSRSKSHQTDNPDLVWHVGPLTDKDFLQDLLQATKPDEIYNLAAVSRPALSWDIPQETTQLNAVVPQHLCEILVKTRPTCRLFQASSSDMFGESDMPFQNETTCCRPQSPYGISKAFAHQLVGAYRKHYGLHASCGILFNHESPLRPLHYVSKKIAHAAAAISLGQTETRNLDERGRPIVSDGKLHLGNINVRRDFGFAGDVAQAMYLIVQNTTPDDFVVGTGQSHSIAEFCEAAFNVVRLDWREHVVVDSTLVRASDMSSQADSTKLVSKLGWKPQVMFLDLVTMMVNERITELTKS